jgi:ABC-2 type transport system permease protein
MIIFRFELKNYMRTLWIWAISIIALLILFMAFFPVMAEDSQMMDKILENYPEELLKAFGMSEYVPMSTVSGYYAFLFAFVQLCMAVQSAYYGFNFLSVEERERTADFLFSKPVSRRRIFVEKYGAALMALLLTNIALWVGTYISIELFRGANTFEATHILILLASMPLFQLVFFSIGLIVTALTRKIGSVISYAMGVAFGLYMLNAIRSIVGGKFLGVLSPYYYFEPGYILSEGSLNLMWTLLAILIIGLATGIGYKRYVKRNIHAL